MITVEYILAFPENQEIEFIEIENGATLQDALRISRLDKKAKDLIQTPKYGVFNQIVEHNYILKNGDRIEVYRPLIIDPKTARKIRAMKKSTHSK